MKKWLSNLGMTEELARCVGYPLGRVVVEAVRGAKEAREEKPAARKESAKEPAAKKKNPNAKRGSK